MRRISITILLLVILGALSYMLWRGNNPTQDQQSSTGAMTSATDTTDTTAAPPTASAALTREANILGQAFINKKYDLVIDRMYPNAVTLAGGREAVLESLKKSDTADFTIESVQFGDPTDIYIVEGEMQSTIPETLTIKLDDGTLIVKSTLIALSSDSGVTWTFIDTAEIDTLEKLRVVDPKISSKIVIPAKTEPIFYPN